jgi:hypothetical protein
MFLYAIEYVFHYESQLIIEGKGFQASQYCFLHIFNLRLELEEVEHKDNGLIGCAIAQ